MIEHSIMGEKIGKNDSLHSFCVLGQIQRFAGSLQECACAVFFCKDPANCCSVHTYQHIATT